MHVSEAISKNGQIKCFKDTEEKKQNLHLKPEEVPNVNCALFQFPQEHSLALKCLFVLT